MSGAESAPGHVAAPPVAAVVLAAGRSSRMGAENKLLSDLGGRPMIARVVERVSASAVDSVIVVTGHDAAAVAGALSGLPVRFAHNRDWPGGISGSLRVGLAAVPPESAAAVICLGDMPEVTPGLIDRLIAAFDPDGGGTICVPVYEGGRGNPVLWGRRHFAAMAALEGDVGARRLMGVHVGEVREVPVAESAVTRDVDTPDALAALRRSGVFGPVMFEPVSEEGHG